MTHKKSITIAKKLRIYNILWKYLVFIFILGISLSIYLRASNIPTEKYGSVIFIGFIILFGILIQFKNDITKRR